MKTDIIYDVIHHITLFALRCALRGMLSRISIAFIDGSNTYAACGPVSFKKRRKKIPVFKNILIYVCSGPKISFKFIPNQANHK